MKKIGHNLFRIYFEKLIVISLTTGLCVLILEAGLRFLGRMPNRINGGIYEQWGDSFCLRKNMIFYKNEPLPPFYFIITNSFGFRDKQIGERDIDSKDCYVFLGASDVFGNAVNYEDSFVGIFSEAARQKNIEVLNLAVGGHRIQDQEELLQDFLKKQNIKLVKVILCINPSSIASFDSRRSNYFVKNGYGFHVPKLRVQRYRFLIDFFASTFLFFQEHWYKIKANLEDVPEYLTVYSKKNRMFEPSTIKRFENYMDQFRNFCDNINAELIYIYLPLIDSFELNDLLIAAKEDTNNYDISLYDKLIVTYCKNRGLKYLNLRPLLIDYHNKGVQLRFETDEHYNIFANQVIGKQLIQKLLSMDNIIN